ncbi:MAG TPA: short-chain fatty acyl-CoA regulator family protein [Gemmatimonadales bacterium]|nr:short-chain fatty acyl-CoA regulator family protein [Gemmatimonadales bacterium]
MSQRTLGSRIRRLRLDRHLTQAALAERSGISASYLNLLEHGRRRISAELLVRLAGALDLDLRTLGAEGDAGLLADLAEAFGDALFDDGPVPRPDLEALVGEAPDLARAVLRLYRAYDSARQSVETLAARELDRGEVPSVGRVRLSSEQVSDFIQRQMNHFPALEEAAERLWRDARLDREGLYGGLCAALDREFGVRVRIATVEEVGGIVRRFDPARRELVLSETLRRGSRNFQCATQLGHLRERGALEALTDDPMLDSGEARALGRMALASYYAAAVLMPYLDFHRGAEDSRYDVELLGHRFRVGWEQVCHRLTTLRRPGAEGVAFHFVRVDVAGNISKKFSATAVRFPRFSGLCPLWNVHGAFLQPGRVRVQLSRLPDGSALFSVARTVQRHAGGWREPPVLQAVGIGCDLDDASRLVYAEGMDLGQLGAAVPIGISCRVCERLECRARAFPSLHHPLQLDENVRGVSFFTPAPAPGGAG